MPSHVDPAIFVHAQLGSKPVVFRAMEELRLRQAEAVGYLVMLWGGCALHQEDGCIAHCSDEQIEAWANWRGRRGWFAAFIRAHHVDESGVLNEWPDWAGKLSVQRAKDRERQRRKRAEQGPKPTPVPGLSTDGPRDVTGTVHGQSTDRHASVTLQSEEEENLELRSSSSSPSAREAFLAAVPEGRRRWWAAKIAAWVDGLGTPTGKPFSWEQIEAGLGEYLAASDTPTFSPQHVVRFVEKVATRTALPQRAPRDEAPTFTELLKRREGAA
jgi:hypothetical protein